MSFQFEGQDYIGYVNRITKRATVLVEDKQGELYNNGKRYRKFYIPVGMLEVVGKYVFQPRNDQCGFPESMEEKYHR